MQTTNIVRRIDNLGRVVIPKGIRSQMNIQENDEFEIFIDNKTNEILLKPLKVVADDLAPLKNAVADLKDADLANKILEIIENFSKTP